MLRIAATLLAAVSLLLATAIPSMADGDIEYDSDGHDIELGPTDPGDPDTWDSYDTYEYDTDDGGTSDTGDTNVEDDDPCLGDAELIDPGTCFGFGGPIPPEDAPTPIVVDPGELAEETLETLPLPAPEVHMAPAGTNGAPSVVNLPTWLWVDGGWAPLSESATAGDTTVTVTVKPVRVDFDMGAGSTSCDGPGTAWRGGDRVHSPSGCDYTYASDGEYDWSAVIQFEATWTCSGYCLADSGSLGTVAGDTSSGAVAVTERQSVVID